MICSAEEDACRLSIVIRPLYRRHLSIYSIWGILGASLNLPSVDTEDDFSYLQNKEMSILQCAWVEEMR